MSYFVINPGTGRVNGATKERAVENACRLEKACGEGVTFQQMDEAEDEGRWLFMFRYRDKKVEVLMPGCPFEDLVYTRMYVDGSSWIWEFGVSQTKYHLGLSGA
jgi:hypothetical protein